MGNRVLGFLAVWAVSATVGLAYIAGRSSAEQVPAQVSPQTTQARATQLPVRQSKQVPPNPVLTTAAKPPAPEAAFPNYVSTIPNAFRGDWDELIPEGCQSHARFHFGERDFANFEVQWQVSKVKLYSATEMDLHTTLQNDEGNQENEVWQFKLVDGGKTLTGRRKGASFFKRCPGGA